MPVSQVAILCGGLGTRLGALTAKMPKPLLTVGGQPFLDRLLFEFGRRGFRRILLLASFESSAVERFARESVAAKRFGLEITVAVETGQAGTGGALRQAQALLDDEFVVLNGDTWFDINPHALIARRHETGATAAIALRKVRNATGFGVIDIDGARISRFRAECSAQGRAFVNGGVAACSREMLSLIAEKSSLERDVWPVLATRGALAGLASEGYFIDIGAPADYARAQTEVAAQQYRPAVFFDRDGVLNLDHGYVGQIERFDWVDGAVDAVRAFNEAGWYVFVITNQAGVARGYYTEADVASLHGHMRTSLAEQGAFIDEFRYCPHHAEGTVTAYRKQCSRRKPAPGMIEDVIREWPVDRARSVLIGDKDTDVGAAAAAGVTGHKFSGGSLLEFVSAIRCL